LSILVRFPRALQVPIQDDSPIDILLIFMIDVSNRKVGDILLSLY